MSMCVFMTVCAHEYVTIDLMHTEVRKIPLS